MYNNKSTIWAPQMVSLSDSRKVPFPTNDTHTHTHWDLLYWTPCNRYSHNGSKALGMETLVDWYLYSCTLKDYIKTPLFFQYRIFFIQPCAGFKKHWWWFSDSSRVPVLLTWSTCYVTGSAHLIRTCFASNHWSPSSLFTSFGFQLKGAYSDREVT